MLRPFLSLLVAGFATAAGFGLSWVGAATHAALVARSEPDPGGLALGLAGALLLALAAMIDEIPILACLAARADGETRITGAELARSRSRSASSCPV